MNRSYLFVPADSERKLARARDARADALILDLEDSVTPAARPAARELAAAYLGEGAECELWVRINPLTTGDAMLDLRAVMPAAPAGIVLPKSRGADDVVRLAKLLDALEVELGLPNERTAIMPITTERPAALFGLHEYAGSSARLRAMTWGAEDLSAVLGASEKRAADGSWLPVFELARSLCLLGAAAAEVAPVDTVYTDFRDEDGLAASAGRARRDGFSGMLAIHPSQVPVINSAFTPSAAEIARAKKIIALFADHEEAGTLAMDGEMIDRPHLTLAKRILALADTAAAH